MSRTFFITYTSSWEGFWYEKRSYIKELSLGYIQIFWYKGDIIKDIADYQRLMVSKGMPKFKERV